MAADTQEAPQKAAEEKPTQPEAPPVPAIELSRGDICCIDGLKEANGLNGVTCTLWRQDPESLRWEVKLPDGEVKALKACHLLFRSISPIEDDGSLTLVGMASDNPSIHRALETVKDLIRQGSEGMSLLASVVSPLGGRKAQGEEGRIWLKLAKQAEQKVRGTLEDLQKTMEAVDGVDASRFGIKAAAEIRMARKDLVQFVQKAQEQLEAGLARLKVVLQHLVITVPPITATHSFTEEESLHEKYREAFEKLEEVVEKVEVKKTKLTPITVKYQGRGDNPPASDNLYVKGLPGWMTESDVEALFSEVGDIQSMKLKSADWGAIAFVRLANKTQAGRAIEEYHNCVPELLERKQEELDGKKLSAEITKGMLRATVDQLARGLTVIADLRKPLGCAFTDDLVTKAVQEDGHGFELGIRVSWRVRSVGGMRVSKVTELKERLAKLMAEGQKECALVFSPPPINATFNRRPFGFTVAKDADLGLIYVNASDGLARAQGVRPGALVSTVAGKDMSSLKLEQVRDVLLKAETPLFVKFEQARGLPNSVTGVLHPVPDEEMPLAPAPEPVKEVVLDGPMVSLPPVDLDIDLSLPIGITFDERLRVETVQKGSQAARLGIGPGWQVLGMAGEELSSRKEFQQKLEAFKAEGSLGQSIMFQPAKVTAVRARELEAASAAAAFRERAAHLDDAAQARKNMQEVSLEMDLSQPLGILFNKFLEADKVNEGSQSAGLGVEPGWRLLSLAGESFKETPQLVAKIQALKAESATKVTAIFLAPKLFKVEPEEVKMELTLDLTQPLGIGFRDNLEAKEIKSGSQGATLGLMPGWRLVTLNGDTLSNSKELVAKMKALKGSGSTSATSSWKRPAQDFKTVAANPQESLGITWSGLTVEAVAPASQADGLGVTPGWRLHEVNDALVETAEEKLKSLENEAEVQLRFLVTAGPAAKRQRTE